jgi:putative ABC transport system permease protein
MTSVIAWRNLVTERTRFIVTLVGIAFAVVLMTAQSGLLVGSAKTASGLIEHSGADFWIAARGTGNVDQSVFIPSRWRYKALEVPGVASADKAIVHFTDWRRPDGRSEIVIIVGVDPESSSGGPWGIVDGSRSDLRRPDGIIIDRLYARKLGVSAVGQIVEMRGRRAQVVGFTDGIRAFTQSPYVFTTYDNALRYGRVEEGRANYLMVRTTAGADKARIARELRRTLPDADILSAADFSAMTARYWLLTTGAGAALIAGALLGVIVGVIVVAQTLYAATVERLPEYATLSAIGAPSSYLNRIVLTQALISGALGYAIGVAAAGGLVAAAANSSFALIMPWWLAVGVFGVTLAMCGAASVIAIHKIKTIDPTAVFR